MIQRMNQAQLTAEVRRNLGVRIRMLRKEQRLTQKVLGLMIGLDRSYLSAIERGKRNVSLENLVKISSGLGITLATLFAGVEGTGHPDGTPRSDYVFTRMP